MAAGRAPTTSAPRPTSGPVYSPPPPVYSPAPAPVPQVSVPTQATHTATPDPHLEEYLGRVQTRLDQPTDTTREVNQFGQQVDQFAEGQRSQSSGDYARRGMLGNSGSEMQAKTEIGNVAAGNFAKGAADINLQRARDDDAFLLASGSAFGAPGQNTLAQQSLGAQTANSQASLNLAAQQSNQQAAMDQQRLALQQQEAQRQAALQSQSMMLAAQNSLYS